jgi:hypothetical protein
MDAERARRCTLACAITHAGSVLLSAVFCFFAGTPKGAAVVLLLSAGRDAWCANHALIIITCNVIMQLCPLLCWFIACRQVQGRGCGGVHRCWSCPCHALLSAQPLKLTGLLWWSAVMLLCRQVQGRGCGGVYGRRGGAALQVRADRVSQRGVPGVVVARPPVPNHATSCVAPQTTELDALAIGQQLSVSAPPRPMLSCDVTVCRVLTAWKRHHQLLLSLTLAADPLQLRALHELPAGVS